MTSKANAHRIAATAALLLSLGVFAAALLGPAETFAQTHRSACVVSRNRADSHACGQKSHSKAKKRRKHHAKLHGGASSGKSATAGSAASVPARCENGHAPTLGAEEIFSCEDGSQPECQDGATPTLSPGGSALVCPLLGEEKAAGEAAECEQEEAGEDPGEGTENACEVSE
jgi:hypothetical protein